MTLKTTSTVKTSDEITTDYAAGNLSPAKHMIMACQAEISPDVAKNIRFQESIATNFMDEAHPISLSNTFMNDVLAKLPMQNRVADDDTIAINDPDDGLAPKTLRDVLGHGLRALKWKSLVPGVAIHDIMGNRHYETDRLYLLKAKGGMRMPEHSHHGEEWTLILTGSYTTGCQRFTRGDLHVESDDMTHRPIIDEGEDCICLVMTQGPLKMHSFMAKLMQPMVGI